MIEIYDRLFSKASQLREELLKNGADFEEVDIPAWVVFPDEELDEYPKAIQFLRNYIKSKA